jgi:hypothetical protein
MINISSLRRASLATFIFSTISMVGTTRLNGVCPHFFGNS